MAPLRDGHAVKVWSSPTPGPCKVSFKQHSSDDERRRDGVRSNAPIDGVDLVAKEHPGSAAVTYTLLGLKQGCSATVRVMRIAVGN